MSRSRWLVAACLPGAIADIATGTSTSSKVIWHQPTHAMQVSLNQGRLPIDIRYEVNEPDSAESSGSRLTKAFVCVLLSGSAAWFCRQHWDQVETAIAEIRAGVRYSAVPDGETLLTVDSEQARRAPFRVEDQESTAYLFLLRCRDALQSWAAFGDQRHGG
ncbi:unnamed protein product [Effrenium voratum]|nr:unnamed protein product [Effrenium voratum]